MRLLSLVFLAIVLCAGIACGQAMEPVPTKPITLDQALETAFQCSPQIKAAISQIEKSRGGMAEANARFLPTFNAQVNQTYQGPPVTISVAGMGTFNVVNAVDTAGQISMYLPLDVSRKLSFATDMANCQFQFDYLALVTASEKLIFDVKTAYYDLLRAQGQEEVAQSAVDVAAERLKDTNAKYAVGTAPKFDVTRAQVEVANLNQKLISAKSRVGVVRATLNRVLGLDVNLPTEPVRGDIVIENIKVDVAKSIRDAYDKRPEVKQADTAIALAKKNVRYQRTGVFPSASVNAQYTYDVTPAGFSPVNTSWATVVGVTIPIWDGGVTKAKVDQANADVDKSIESLDNVKLGVGLDVQSAALVLQEGIERVATTAENVSMAEEALRLANVRYNGGISTLVEVTDAESALTQAKNDYVNARFDYVVGVAGLQRAVGDQPELAKLQLLGTQSYKTVGTCLTP